VRAAGIQPGDLVITTPFSFVASTNVLLYENAIPVFVDVDPLSGNIDPALVAQALRDLNSSGPARSRWLPRKGAEQARDVKAIVAVDVFGQPADMDALRGATQHSGMRIIEDSCEALGAEYKHRPAGTLGDMGVFAFYPNKQITTGEGGMIVTDDEQAAHMMRALRNQGRAPGDTWLQHTYLGYNYRLDEMSAALGEVQMKRLPELLEARSKVAGWYQERLAEIAAVETPRLAKETTRVSWFVYVIRLAEGIEREAVAAKLGELGIPVRPYFLPIHLQPYLVERFGYQPGDYPVSENLGNRGLALPFSGKMSEAQVETVCRALQSVY
jgi:dTDP-4-amino-4,6-dideoxygalactose transaminase